METHICVHTRTHMHAFHAEHESRRHSAAQVLSLVLSPQTQTEYLPGIRRCGRPKTQNAPSLLVEHTF